MTRLEQRYRRLLGMLPAWYRAEREQEMVDVFLSDRSRRENADLDAEHGWPGWGETAAVAGLAVRTRIGGDAAPPGPRAVGAAVRAAGGLGVLLSAGGAAATVLWQLVAILVGAPGNIAAVDQLLHPVGADGWWNTSVQVLGLLWLPAWTALSSGRRRAAVLLAVAAGVPDVVGVVRDVAGYGASSTTVVGITVSLLNLVTLALLLLGFHRDAAPVSVARPWALLAGAVVAMAATIPFELALLLIRPEAGALLLVALGLALTRRGGPLAAGVAVLAGVPVVSGLLDLAAREEPHAGSAISLGLGLAAALIAATAARRSPARRPTRHLAET